MGLRLPGLGRDCRDEWWDGRCERHHGERRIQSPGHGRHLGAGHGRHLGDGHGRHLDAGTGGHGSATGTGGSATGTAGTTGRGSSGGSTAAAAARRAAAAARAEAARRVAAARRAPAVEAAAAPRRRSGTAGTGGSGTGGSGTGVTVNLGATRQTIEGFGLNTALSSATPNWDTFYTATGSGLGLSIVRVAMQSNGSLSGSCPAGQLQREGHRVALDCARQLQGQQQYAEGWAPAHELLRLVVDGDRQLRQEQQALRDGGVERARLRVVWVLHRSTLLQRLRHDGLHGQRDGEFRQGAGTEAQEPPGSSSSRPNRRSGSTSGAMLRPRARPSRAIRTARTR